MFKIIPSYFEAEGESVPVYTEGEPVLRITAKTFNMNKDPIINFYNRFAGMATGRVGFLKFKLSDNSISLSDLDKVIISFEHRDGSNTSINVYKTNLEDIGCHDVIYPIHENNGFEYFTTVKVEPVPGYNTSEILNIDISQIFKESVGKSEIVIAFDACQSNLEDQSMPLKDYSSVSCLAISYEDTGLESHKKYDEYTLGNMYKGYMSLKDGEVFHSFYLGSTINKKNPIPLYAYAHSDKMSFSSFSIDTFRTNYHYFLSGKEYYDDVNYEYIYDFILTDPTGNKIQYYMIAKEYLRKKVRIKDSVYEDLPSKLYYSDIDQSYLIVNNNSVELVNRNNDILEFECYNYYKKARLASITDKYNNRINIYWNSENKISSITNSCMERLDFRYEESDIHVDFKCVRDDITDIYFTSSIYYDDYLFYVEIDSDDIRSVVNVEFDYDDSRYIISEENSNKSLIYYFDENRSIYMVRKCNAVNNNSNENIDVANIAVDEINYEYYGQSTKKYSFNDFEYIELIDNYIPNKKTYYFDDFGTVIQVISDKGEIISNNYREISGRLLKQLNKTSYFESNDNTINNIINNLNNWKQVKALKNFATTMVNLDDISLVNNTEKNGVSYLSDRVLKISGNIDEIYYKQIYKVFDNINGLANERLVFNVLSKGFSVSTGLYRAFVEIYYDDESVKKYCFDFNKNYSDWQSLSGSILPYCSYRKVALGFEYDGVVDCYFDSIQLYRGKTGSLCEYDDFGNIVNINSDNENISFIYDEAGNLTEKCSSNGACLRYAYDSKDRVTSIKDQYDNFITYSYDANNNVIKEKLVTKDNEVFEQNMLYDLNGNLIRFTDCYGNVFVNEYDSLSHILSEQILEKVHKKYTYLQNYVIDTIKFDSLVNIDSETAFDYDDNMNIIGYSNGDNHNYKFDYDYANRLKKIYKNNPNFVYNTYNYRDPIRGIYTNEIKEKIYGDNWHPYEFIYNKNNKLASITELGDTISEFNYDNKERLISNRDYLANNKINYIYDNENRVVREEITDNNDNKLQTISYTYDNLNNIQKVGYFDDEQKRCVDYDYDYEGKKSLVDVYFNMLENKYDCEVIKHNLSSVCLYGGQAEYTDVNNILDMNLKRNVLSFNSFDNYLNYNLDTFFKNSINSKDIINDFKEHKSFMAWVKFSGNFNDYNLFSFKYGGFNNRSNLCINNEGKLVYKDNEGNILKITDNCIVKGEYCLVGIELHQYTDLNKTKRKAVITLNGVTTSEFDIDEDVSMIKYFYVCNNDAVEAPYMQAEFINILSGPFKIYPNEVKKIYEEGIRVFSLDSKRYTSTMFYDLYPYRGFDIVNFNGNLTTSEGLKPVKFNAPKDVYNGALVDAFKYDVEKGRYLYKSIADDDGTGSLLAYEHPLTNKGSASIKFKYDNTNVNKPILYFKNNDNVVASLYIDGTSLYGLFGSREVRFSTANMTFNKWYSLVMTYYYSETLNKTQMILGIYSPNGTCNYYQVSLNSMLDLTNTILYVGCDGNNNCLNGLISTLGMSENALFINEKFDSKRMEELVEQEAVIINRNEVDSINRIVKNEIITNDNVLTKTYTYDKQRVISEVFSDESTISYEYDANGNIVTKTLTDANGIILSCDSYVYDNFGRLKNEIDKDNNRIITLYDINGNITRRMTSDLQNGYEYVYDSDNLDKLVGLVKYEDGKDSTITIEYHNEDIFKPVKIITKDRSLDIKWIGKKMTEYDGVSFVYNNMGVRIAKDTGNEHISYLLEGNRIIAMKVYDRVNERHIRYDFVYNEYGEVIALFTNNKYYYYERDITKNINKIIDSNGNVMVKYKYDAWGKIIEEQVSLEILKYNPFAYKGYVYDKETQLFYCNSRYYSPELCRWISPDSIEYLDPESINGLNLYCYCYNNPISYADPSGNLPQWAMWLIGGVVIAGLAIATIATGGAAGGVAGFILAGALKGAVVGAVSGALVNGTISGISSAIDGDGFWSGFFDGAAHGFMSGAVIGGITGAISSGAQVYNASKLWANTGNKTAYQQMVEHYGKHVIREGQKSVAKNIVNYSKKASQFFANNSSSGFALRQGVIKIAGAPGGIFNADGLIRSFWYVLL